MPNQCLKTHVLYNYLKRLLILKIKALPAVLMNILCEAFHNWAWIIYLMIDNGQHLFFWILSINFKKYPTVYSKSCFLF